MNTVLCVYVVPFTFLLKSRNVLNNITGVDIWYTKLFGDHLSLLIKQKQSSFVFLETIS